MYLIPREHPSQPLPPSRCSRSPESTSWAPRGCSSFPLAICFTHDRVFGSLLGSRFTPPSPSPSGSRCSLCLHLYSCWRECKLMCLVFLWPAPGCLTLSRLCTLIPTDTRLSSLILPQALWRLCSQVEGGASYDFWATFQAISRSTQGMPT